MVDHDLLNQPPPSRETKAAQEVLALVDALQQRVQSLDDPEIRLVVTPTTEPTVEDFESRRGLRLPASYRALVLEKGTLHVEVHGYKTMWMIPVSDLGGPEPTCWEGEGDPAVDHNVQTGIFFAYENDDSVENFHAFDPDTLDDEGEMCVGTYYHDARYEGGGVSFVEYLRREIESLFERFIPAVMKYR